MIQEFRFDTSREPPAILFVEVFENGETSSSVYVVASGSLRIQLSESSKLVSFAEAGALFGEYAMFTKGVRTARVESQKLEM